MSCDFFQKKKLAEEEMIDTIIDYKSVDTFPLFPDCDSIPSQDKQRVCSQIKLSEHIFASLSESNIITARKVADTVRVKLLVSSSGKVSLTNVEMSDNLLKQIPTIDSLLKNSIVTMPVLKPALKRGIPVATEFSLPIVIVN
ncbi:hypothetical protein [Urechidicola vernalis]|uniref:TonB C-terminal domain-containing protein n=1 Tax=Urechidicola vernalis TaxID=3075600 RepID=A0ABU2Y4Q4_9FLAO|nr:hypothetical protein [Urechidicola sp. P050]MDT0552806.1 hypothetical protein [Urechidicola sp. P050]